MAKIPLGTTRAAVVIGVNKTNGLPKLKGAASGALEMKVWLKKEGGLFAARFEVAVEAVFGDI